MPRLAKYPLYLLTFSFSFCFSQTNLVPNPSFEDTLNCSTYYGQAEAAYPWFNPTYCTPDYFRYFNCGPSPFEQVPRTGISYMGIYMYIALTGGREYISVKLDSALLPGVKYKASFYVSRSNDCRYAIDRIGAYFSIDTNGFYANPCEKLQFNPQVSNSLGNVISDTVNWILLSAAFYANGGEEFLTIGNFYDSTNTTMISSNPSSSWYSSYYYIEDVSVVRCDSCFVGGINENADYPLKIFPNPMKESAEIFFPFSTDQIFKISLLDATGKIVNPLVERNKMSKKIILQRNNLAEGIYFINIQTIEYSYTAKLLIIN